MGAERVPIPNHPGYWRRGGRVTFKYRDERRRVCWGSAPTLKAAKRKRAQLETDAGRGELSPRSRETFKGYALTCIDTFRGRTSKPIQESTRKNYRRRLKEEAIPFFGDMLLTEIRPQHVKAFVRHVSERRRRGERYAKDLDPVSQNTVRLALAPVKIVLATAFEEGLIRVNPAAGVRIVVPRDLVDDEDELGQVKALTDAELTLVMKKLPGATPGKPLLWRLFFHVLLHLGLRIGEAIELRWRDVDLGKGTVRIRRKYFEGEVGPPKSRFGRRTLKLTDELSAALWELRKQTRGLDDDLVFVSPRGHRIIPSNLESRVLKPAAIAAGVPWVNCHTFRHTCATLLFTKGGWNAKQVQLWLGHHSPTFTIERYVHLLPDDLPEPVQLTLLALEQVDDVQAAVTA